MITFIMKGGVLMGPILLCSVIALAIIIERFIKIRSSKIMPQDFLDEVQDLVQKRKISEAEVLCKNNNSPMSSILLKAIQSFGQGRDLIKEKIEEVGKREIAQLEKGCGLLGTVASVSPLLGLLGTVFGMIKVFNDIAFQGVGNANSLAGGISEALITTAAGLSVAIPTLVAYRYFLGRIEGLVHVMEERSREITDLLGEK
ncbi:MAG: MotA/TolQ/ExbB proton channel family protein [Deltaproteobacteria bacterium]|nr:MotA/TolQ/ExbB proton channel family protein [Deltaproteobacteria bacterium]